MLEKKPMNADENELIEKSIDFNKISKQYSLEDDQYTLNAAKKKKKDEDDEDDFDEEEDDYYEKEEEEENPFDVEPSEDDLTEDFPDDDEDLFDDDEDSFR